jgi:hypothetical protein
METSLTPPKILRYPNDPQYKAVNRLYQSAPAVEITAKGKLYVIFDTGGKGEESGNFNMVVTSGDQGKTWTDAEIVIEHPDPEMRVFNAQLWMDPLERLWLTWTQSKSWFDGRHGVWAMVSEEPDSLSPRWSQPRRIANGLMMNKPTVLRSGEWLFPCAIWNYNFAEHTEEHLELANEIHSNVYSSLDNGKTFTLKGGAEIKERAFDEHMVIEGKDGDLWMLVRTKYGIGQSFSKDGGKTWPPGENSGIPGPNSRFFIRRLASGRLLLVNHKTKNSPEKYDHVRKDLCAWLSEDEGRTWKGGFMLDERINVSYPDGTQDKNGLIYIVYDRERTKDKEILMAQFTEEDVFEGRPASLGCKLKMIVSKALGKADKKNAH